MGTTLKYSPRCKALRRMWTHLCTNGLVTLNKPRTGTGIKWKVQYAVEMFTMVWDRDRDKNIVSYCASPIPCTGASPIPVQCDFTIRRQENGRDIHTDTMNTIDKKISPNFQEKEVISQRSDCKAKSVVWKPTPLKYQITSGINRNKSSQEKILITRPWTFS